MSRTQLNLALAVLVGQVSCGCARPPQGHAGVPGAPPRPKAWVLRAQKLIGELESLAESCPKKEFSTWKDVLDAMEAKDEALTGWGLATGLGRAKRADRLLWDLWVATGRPPSQGSFTSPDDTYRSLLQAHAAAYREYVARHRHLSEGDLHRLGLANAVAVARTPLWLVALRYIDEVTDLSLGDVMQVHTTPHVILVSWDLREESNYRIASALAVWVKSNKNRLVWVSRERRFVSKDGRFRGTEAVMDRIADALSGDLLGARAGRRSRPQTPGPVLFDDE